MKKNNEVLKLLNIEPEIVENNGFVEILGKDELCDICKGVIPKGDSCYYYSIRKGGYWGSIYTYHICVGCHS